MPRYLKFITYPELCKLWGMEIPLPIPARGKKLYLRVKKDGTPHKQGGGSYVHEGELRDTDVIHEDKPSHVAIICSQTDRGYLVGLLKADHSLDEESIEMHFYVGDAAQDAGLRQLSAINSGIKLPIISPKIDWVKQ